MILSSLLFQSWRLPLISRRNLSMKVYSQVGSCSFLLVLWWLVSSRWSPDSPKIICLGGPYAWCLVQCSSRSLSFTITPWSPCPLKSVASVSPVSPQYSSCLSFSTPLLIGWTLTPWCHKPVNSCFSVTVLCYASRLCK